MFVVLKANDKYYIDKMQMNGLGTRSVFVESNLLRGPKVSLCYDTDKKKIFWSDQGTKRIASASLTGLYIDSTDLYISVNTDLNTRFYTRN